MSASVCPLVTYHDAIIQLIFGERDFFHNFSNPITECRDTSHDIISALGVEMTLCFPLCPTIETGELNFFHATRAIVLGFNFEAFQTAWWRVLDTIAIIIAPTDGADVAQSEVSSRRGCRRKTKTASEDDTTKSSKIKA